MEKNKAIGVFDSGVGGISVLARAAQCLPHENFIYYADTANFPYGDQNPKIIKAGLIKAAQTMAENGVKAIVVACNTATSVAIEDIREIYNFPILGMEPALKPAVEKSANKTVAVIATTLTLRESKFRHLLAQCEDKGNIINLPAPGLADLVEGGHYNDDMAAAYIDNLFAGLEHLDSVVLGCTHYLFLEPIIKKHYPNVEIIDGGSGTVRNLCRILQAEDLLSLENNGEIKVFSSKPELFIPQFQGYYDYIQKVISE
ncbi:MAG: glutamate racemase [Clostridiales bacterium]